MPSHTCRPAANDQEDAAMQVIICPACKWKWIIGGSEDFASDCQSCPACGVPVAGSRNRDCVGSNKTQEAGIPEGDVDLADLTPVGFLLVLITIPVVGVSAGLIYGLLSAVLPEALAQALARKAAKAPLSLVPVVILAVGIGLGFFWIGSAV